MKIDCIADLHGFYPKLEGGDLLIIAGDLTRRDEPAEHRDFVTWLMEIQDSDRRYRKIVYIAGNHDNFLDPNSEYNNSEKGQWKHHRPKRRHAEGMEIALNPNYGIEYLCDSGTTYHDYEGKREIKIWGSPWTSQFEGINPLCCAFTMPFGCDNEQHLADKWAMIPEDTDILITHGPPHKVLDRSTRGVRCGSKSLFERLQVVQPRLHIFGHIHEKGHKQAIITWPFECAQISENTLKTKLNQTIAVNCSHVNVCYSPVFKPVRIIL